MKTLPATRRHTLRVTAWLSLILGLTVLSSGVFIKGVMQDLYHTLPVGLHPTLFTWLFTFAFLPAGVGLLALVSLPHFPELTGATAHQQTGLTYSNAKEKYAVAQRTLRVSELALYCQAAWIVVLALAFGIAEPAARMWLGVTTFIFAAVCIAGISMILASLLAWIRVVIAERSTNLE